MGKDELRQALNEASAGPERDFTGTWAQGRKVRRRRQTAQGLGVVAVAAAAVGAFALGGGNLLGEDATIEPLPPATQTPTADETTDESTDESTEEAASEEATEATETEAPGPNDPLPTTVEEYARVYLTAGMAGDEELLARMGTDEAVEASVTWTHETWLLDEATISDRGSGEVQVEFLAEGPFVVILSLDREAVEAGAVDGVLHGEPLDAPAIMTPEEYADLMVEMWPIGSAGMYATDNTESTLEQVPTEGSWERTGSSVEGEVVLVTYENTAVEGELVLTVDPLLVELREYQAVVDASFSGDQEIGAPTTHPCDEPWSQVPSPGSGGASDNAELAALDLLDLAAACNLEGLAGRAEQEATVLSLGGATPAEAFAGEQGRERARAMALLLSTYQPVLETGDEGQTVAVWPGLTLDRLDELVELGLYTQEEIDTMRDDGAYTGWRIMIDEDGHWLSMVEGD